MHYIQHFMEIVATTTCQIIACSKCTKYFIANNNGIHTSVTFAYYESMLSNKLKLNLTDYLLPKQYPASKWCGEKIDSCEITNTPLITAENTFNA